MNDVIANIEKLDIHGWLEKEEFLAILNYHEDEEIRNLLAYKARIKAQRIYGTRVYTRGLIEFSNFCKNDCYYCGIRRSNHNIDRYRLSKDDIMSCCENGYALGFRTFVLQGGEDYAYSDDEFSDIIKNIHLLYPDCAITLSIGERSKDTYQRFFNAGANRFLLRHETSNPYHYRSLHPSDLNIENRKRCLWDLKDIGYQVGTGFMVGSPNQTYEHIVEDLAFIKELQPHMVGIGPFIPHHDTPFKAEKQGGLHLTLILLSMIRLMLANVLLPSTTALGTIHPKGRELGILAGANVVMPNLSPLKVRKKYELYDNKICTGEEAAECRGCLANRMKSIGYEIVTDRGDYVASSFTRKIEEKNICTINIL